MTYHNENKSTLWKSRKLRLTTHYYVLSLSEQTSKLYEAFRDTLIDIQNTGFPIESSAGMNGTVAPALTSSQLRKFVRTADQHFEKYFRQDPLRLVVVGDKNNLSIFGSVTSHQDALLGVVEGDYAATSPHDLGKIVWPIVKEVLAGRLEKALHDLETAASSQKVVFGIDAVAHLSGSEVGGSLFIEENYHMKGGISKTDHSLIMSEDLDIQEVIDDAVDAIIENVLEKDGTVVFLERGSLTKFQRIALIMGDR